MWLIGDREYYNGSTGAKGRVWPPAWVGLPRQSNKKQKAKEEEVEEEERRRRRRRRMDGWMDGWMDVKKNTWKINNQS